MIRSIALILIVSSLLSFSYIQETSRLSISFTTEKVHDGEKIVIKAEMFFDLDENKLITKFTHPEQYYFITNSKGEGKVYDPEKNEVHLIEGELISSDSNPLFYFIYSKTFDMGLKDLGYKLRETKKEGEHIVTIWRPEEAELSAVNLIKLVHKDENPVFVEHKKDEQVIRRLYYSSYENLDGYIIPKIITEITYLPDNDSIVSRMSFEDIKLNTTKEKEVFEFKIPDNAKIAN